MPQALQNPKKRWRAKGGLTCLVDVTGFTPLTEELTRLGPEGNEYLSGLLNAFFGALTEEVARADGHILQFCGDALWAYFNNADDGERACRRMLRRIGELGGHAVGGRKYKLQASLAAARGLELELERVGDGTFLVLGGEAVVKVSQVEEQVGPGEYVILHGPGRGRSGGTIVRFLADRPPPPPHRAGLRPTTSVFTLFPQPPETYGLDELVSGLLRRCARYEAFLAKITPFQGRQAALILLGTPRAHDDDPRRGVNLALELVREQGFVGAAVAGGYVYVGPVGGGQRWEYTALGDPVNLAARLLASTGPGQVLVAEETGRLCSADVNLELAWRKRVKGKAGEVTAWLALGRSDALKTVQLRYALVGRKKELARIDALLARGRGLLYILGEAGIGKSRLLMEAQERARTAGFRIVTAQVDRTHRDFGLLKSLVEDLADILDTDPPAFTAAKLEGLFEERLSERPALERRRWRAVIGALVFHLEPDRRLLAGYAPEVVKNSLVEGIGALLRNLATDGLLLAVDDIHLADESSISILQAVLEGFTKADRLLLLATARKEGRFAEKDQRPLAGSGAEELYLGELGEEVWRIGEELLDGLPLEEKVRRWVLEKAQGNPFFVEQLLLDLIERGFIMRRGDRWQAGGGYLPDRLPVNVFATILARVDRLSQPAAEIMRLASVIGQRFDERLIERLLPGKLEALEEAESARLAVRDSREELAYLFRHSLVREVTYRSLLVDERRNLHRDVARAMMELDSKDPQTSYAPGEVAVHLDLAGNSSEAAGHYLKSYEAKKNYGSYDQAEKEAQRALELALEINEPMLAARARLALADVLSLAGRAEESLPLLELAFSGSMELNETRLAVKVCLLAVQSLLRLNRAGDIGVWVEKARRAAGDDPFLEISIAPVRSFPDHFAGNYEQAAEILERAAALLLDPRTDEEVRAMTMVHGNLGILYSMMNLVAEAERKLRTAVELAERTGDRSLVLDSKLNLSVLLTDESRFEEALAIQRRCTEEYEAMGYHLGLSQALFKTAQVELELGEEERATADLSRSLAISRRIHDEAHIARTALFLGYHLTHRGKLDEAHSLIDEALRLYEKNDFDKMKGLAYAVRAYHCARSGDAASARRYLKMAEKNPAVDTKPPQSEILELAREELGGEKGVS